VEQVKSYISF